MAIGDHYNCTCPQTVGIGLPFDHPIWQRLSDGCPIHSRGGYQGFIQTVSLGPCSHHEWRGRHLIDPQCSKCGKRKSEDNTFTITYDKGVQWSWTSNTTLMAIN